MTGQWWEGDDRLVAALEDALRAEAEVPESFAALGKAVYPPPDLDAELAALTYDSAEQPLALALARSGDDEEPAVLRALTYAAPRLTVHLELIDGAVQGQVVPAQRCEVQLQDVHGESAVMSADDDGWFAVRPIPPGRFRLRFRTGDGVVVTGWIAL